MVATILSQFSTIYKLMETCVHTRHGVNSIPELELIVNSNSGIDYLKIMELRNFELELKFPTKKLNPEINLPFL